MDATLVSRVTSVLHRMYPVYRSVYCVPLVMCNRVLVRWSVYHVMLVRVNRHLVSHHANSAQLVASNRIVVDRLVSLAHQDDIRMRRVGIIHATYVQSDDMLPYQEQVVVNYVHQAVQLLRLDYPHVRSVSQVVTRMKSVQLRVHYVVVASINTRMEQQTVRNAL